MKRQYNSSGVRGQDTGSSDAGAGASTAIVVTRASGVARPIVPAVNTRYTICVSTGAPTAVTGVQNWEEKLVNNNVNAHCKYCDFVSKICVFTSTFRQKFTSC